MAGGWLDGLPLYKPVEIEGATVYLAPRAAGSELGAVLIHYCTEYQAGQALALAFSGALHGEAGLGYSPDGQSLVLSRWLPGVFAWRDAAAPLEDLLSRLEEWREAAGLEQPGFRAA
jgi:hypothetical protein